MENKRKAILEVLGYNFEKATARKFFFNVYKYILYNDTDSLLETLEYKKKLQEQTNHGRVTSCSSTCCAYSW